MQRDVERHRRPLTDAPKGNPEAEDDDGRGDARVFLVDVSDRPLADEGDHPLFQGGELEPDAGAQCRHGAEQLGERSDALIAEPRLEGLDGALDGDAQRLVDGLGGDAVDELPEAVGDDRHEHLVLTREVPVEGPQRDAGSVRDRVGANR